MRSLPLIDFLNPIFYFLISESKTFSATLSARSLIMISMLSSFKCITHSSSLFLEGIKSIGIFIAFFTYQIF